MDEKIYTEVRKLVAQELDVDESQVTPQAAFDNDLGADSLAQVELIMSFEEKFGIDNIPDEEADKIKTVQDAVTYISGYLAKKPAE